MTEREVVRCPWCRLNQFATEDGLCRKCRKRLDGQQDAALSSMGKVKRVVSRAQRIEMFDLAFAVRLLRVSAGMSQLDFAAKSGLQRTYISKVETGACVPTIYSLERFAALFEITAEELLTIAEVLGTQVPQEEVECQTLEPMGS